LILSPGDGKIIVCATMEDESGREFQLVSIFLSVFDVHVNRIPISGEVTHVKHVPGKFHRAFEPAALTENERTEITINSKFGEVSFSQVAGILARRIVCGLGEGDRVSRGDRFGLIRFGSRVDIFLQPTVKVQVKLGDRVAGGVSVIGRYPQAR
jgi:phosphatidylserine decarboxylase